MVGFTLNHTIKVRGKIEDHEIVVLVDSGAARYFISNRMVDKLGLKLVDIRSFGVMMGAGKIERNRGICKGVNLALQEVQVLKDFLLLNFRSTDMILEIKWL